MTHRATLRLHLPDPPSAQQAMRCLAADNADFLAVHVDGTFLVLDVRAASPLGLLRTIEDAITCLRATGLVA